MAVMYSRLVPNRSAAQPVSGITVARASVYAVTVHATVEYGNRSPGLPNTVWNVGSATLTTVMSRIDMMAPAFYDDARDLQDRAVDVVGRSCAPDAGAEVGSRGHDSSLRDRRTL